MLGTAKGSLGDPWSSGGRTGGGVGWMPEMEQGRSHRGKGLRFETPETGGKIFSRYHLPLSEGWSRTPMSLSLWQPGLPSQAQGRPRISWAAQGL